MASDRAIGFIRKILREGSWFCSAIELEPWGESGERLEAEAVSIVANGRNHRALPRVRREYQKKTGGKSWRI